VLSNLDRSIVPQQPLEGEFDLDLALDVLGARLGQLHRRSRVFTRNTDFWYTMGHTTSLNLYIRDRVLAAILGAEKEGLVVDTERRQAIYNSLTRAHRINLLMKSSGDQGINGLQQLMGILILIQGLAG